MLKYVLPISIPGRYSIYWFMRTLIELGNLCISLLVFFFVFFYVYNSCLWFALMGIKCMLLMRTPQDTLYCVLYYTISSLATAVSLKMNCMGNEQFERTSVHLIKSNDRFMAWSMYTVILSWRQIELLWLPPTAWGKDHEVS